MLSRIGQPLRIRSSTKLDEEPVEYRSEAVSVNIGWVSMDDLVNTNRAQDLETEASRVVKTEEHARLFILKRQNLLYFTC